MPHPNSIWDLALQPTTDGQVFASACDGIVRLFDIRRSVTGNFKTQHPTTFFFIDNNYFFIGLVPVFQGTEQMMLRSVAFSPVDPMVIASGDSSGTKLFDIRQNSFR